MAGHARAQQKCIDAILDLSRHPATASSQEASPGSDTGPSESSSWWTRSWRKLHSWLARSRPVDPEIAKNLLIFRGLVGEAAELCQRRGLLEAEQCRLTTAMTLPGPAQTPRVLLASRFQLEQVLLDLADRTYITARLAGLYREGPGTYITWTDMYGSTLPALLDPGEAPARRRDAPPDASPAAGQVTPGCAGAAFVDHEVERTRLQLMRLLREKEAQDQVMRARRELINRAVPRTTCVVAVMAAVLAVTSFWVLHHGQLLVLALVSGGTGAALGGLIRLRNQVQWGNQARWFWLAFTGQVLIGSIAGLLAFLVSLTGAVVLSGGDAGVAVFAMALGFSEAAFLGLLSRFAGR